MRASILAVDDESTILFAMSEYFAARGCRISCAHESEEAKALLANLHFDVVIADLRLTGINDAEGLDIIRFARVHQPGARLIILTANGSPEAEQMARDLGVDAFLHKPQPLAVLATTINRLLEAAS
jgi:DNA-binding response OmpR family regulator